MNDVVRVQIPYCVHPKIYGALRQQLGEVLKPLAMQRQSRIEERHLMRDHVAGIDSAQVFGIAGGRVHEGEEYDPHRPDIYGKAEKLHGGRVATSSGSINRPL
jgi:hypothetical protein